MVVSYHSTRRRGGPCVSETRIPGHRITRVDVDKVAFPECRLSQSLTAWL